MDDTLRDFVREKWPEAIDPDDDKKLTDSNWVSININKDGKTVTVSRRDRLDATGEDDIHGEPIPLRHPPPDFASTFPKAIWHKLNPT